LRPAQKRVLRPREEHHAIDEHPGGLPQRHEAPGLARRRLGASTACKGGVGSRDWEFVGEFCPAEAKAIAAQHCAGRDYTAAMESEYKAVCRRYARAGGAGATAQREAPAQQQQQQTQQQQPPAAPAAPSAVDTVKEGANQLRKLFGR
jgi:hypothetical protein